MKKVVERQTLLLGYREEQFILSFAIDKKGEKP